MDARRRVHAAPPKRRQRHQGFAGVDRGQPDAARPDAPISVFGLPATLHQNGELAAYFNEGRGLVPHPGDAGEMGSGMNMMDRYDARLLLEDLSAANKVARRGEVEAREAENATEEDINFERYRDMAAEGGDSEDGRGGDRVEVAAEHAACNTVGRGYGAGGARVVEGIHTGSARDEGLVAGARREDAAFVPTFPIPESLKGSLPTTQRMHKLISQTANFVRDAGGQVEVVLRVKQANNPNFRFLMPDTPLFEYYRWVLENNPKDQKATTESKDEQNLSTPSAPVSFDRNDASELAPERKDSAVSIPNALALLRGYSSTSMDEETEPRTPVEQGHQEFESRVLEAPGPGAKPLETSEEVTPQVEQCGSDNSDCNAKDAMHSSAEVGGMGTEVEDAGAEECDSGPDSEPGVPGADDVPLMHLQGVEPPPETKAIMDKLVKFVKKHGTRFERVVQKKERANPKFGFMLPWHQHHWMYRKRLQEELGEESTKELFSLRPADESAALPERSRVEEGSGGNPHACLPPATKEPEGTLALSNQPQVQHEADDEAEGNSTTTNTTSSNDRSAGKDASPRRANVDESAEGSATEASEAESTDDEATSHHPQPDSRSSDAELDAPLAEEQQEGKVENEVLGEDQEDDGVKEVERSLLIKPNPSFVLNVKRADTPANGECCTRDKDEMGSEPKEGALDEVVDIAVEDENEKENEEGKEKGTADEAENPGGCGGATAAVGAFLKFLKKQQEAEDNATGTGEGPGVGASPASDNHDSPRRAKVADAPVAPVSSTCDAQIDEAKEDGVDDDPVEGGQKGKELSREEKMVQRRLKAKLLLARNRAHAVAESDAMKRAERAKAVMYHRQAFFSDEEAPTTTGCLEGADVMDVVKRRPTVMEGPELPALTEIVPSAAEVALKHQEAFVATLRDPAQVISSADPLKQRSESPTCSNSRGKRPRHSKKRHRASHRDTDARRHSRRRRRSPSRSREHLRSRERRHRRRSQRRHSRGRPRDSMDDSSCSGRTKRRRRHKVGKKESSVESESEGRMPMEAGGNGQGHWGDAPAEDVPAKAPDDLRLRIRQMLGKL